MKRVLKGDGTILGRIAWKLRPTENLKIDSLQIVDGRYVAVASGSRQRLWAFVRVRIQEPQEDPRLDYAFAMRISVQQQRIRGLFEGLYKAAIPFLYISMMSQEESTGEEERFEFDLAVGTWVDGRWKSTEEDEVSLEQRTSVLTATLTVALPGASVNRLLRSELSGFAKNLYLPGGMALQQSGGAAAVASLFSFEEQRPQAGRTEGAPGFYVPNLSESGRGGILLGTVKSGTGTYHDFRLQLEDLRRHLAIVGMTGSGKSTTAGTIVKQVAAQGLPVLVLDWHNEYGDIVSAIGGVILAPGKDDFTTNPLEAGMGSEPLEHLAMVSDIFSDIYHFSHPQAFMFRNALQKRMTDTGKDGQVTLSSLIKTIEAYPLRSAYDNETKVALLRRLVPLTQGQAGRALDGPSTLTFGELLEKVVCVELGHLRDVQTRAIYAELVLKTIYENRVKEKRSLEHLTVVEEARNVAPARRLEDPPSVGERMISELRKFGEAMLFVAQFPSQVASEVIKNSGTRIVHRVAWPEDVRVIGDSMNLNSMQREHVTKLEVGEAIVSLARIPRPILVQVKAEVPDSDGSRDLNSATDA